MRIERLTPAMASAWDGLIDAHEDGWFFHTTAWLHYQTSYQSGNHDASFAIVEDDPGSIRDVDGERGTFAVVRPSMRLLGVIPLMLSHGVGGAPEFSYSGDPLAPGLADGPEIAEFGAAHTLELARYYGVRRALFASSPFGSPCILVLPERPPIQTPYNAAHRVVELKATSEDLWRGVRKSYRSLIHRAQERNTFTSYAGDSAASVAGFVAYQALHRRLATIERSGETYRLQGEWLLDGKALVMLAERPEGVLGAAYWIVDKSCAYYASGAYAEDDLAHAIVWRSLLALRDLGVTHASLGWQGWGRTSDEKWCALEFFRRGFGGADVPAQVMELSFEEVLR